MSPWPTDPLPWRHALALLPKRLLSRVKRPVPLFIPGGPAAPADLPAWFDDWCAAHAGYAVHGLLSGYWTHQVLGQVAAGAAAPDALALARLDWAPFHSVQALQSWSTVGWTHNTGWGACALHGLSLPALQAIAQRHAVNLRHLQPWWARALPWAAARAEGLALGEGVALGLVEPGLLTWMQCDQGHLLSVQQRRLSQAQPLALRVQELLAAQAAPGGVWLAGHGLPEQLQGELAHQGWGQLSRLDASTPAALLEPLLPLAPLLPLGQA